MDSKIANRSVYLDLFTYLDVQDKRFNNMKLKDILDYIEKSPNYKSVADKEEFRVLKEACDNSDDLGNMRLISQSHYDHTDGGKDFFNYSGDSCTDDPIQACAFKSDSGDVYVAYRGTGDGRWGDNAQGFTDVSTDMQEAARDYFDHVVDQYGCEGDLYVTGHSKGGNEAQYVMMTSKHQNEIDGCYSFDGQGFSPDAMERFKDNPNYEKLRHLIYSINGDNDPVHDIIGGGLVPEENMYYVNLHYVDDGGFHFSYVHDMLGMLTPSGIDWVLDENGNITHGTEGPLSQLSAQLYHNLSLLPESVQASCAAALMSFVDMLTGGSLDGADANIFDYAVFNMIGIPVVVASISEFAIKYMYENYGIGGAIATAFVAAGLATGICAVLSIFAFVAEVAHIVQQVIGFAKVVLNKLKDICQNVAQWVGDIFKKCSDFISSIKEWFYTNSPGYKYANANPYIQIHTAKMRDYAQRLDTASRRAKTLDSEMNSYYWHLLIEWDAIPKLAMLLKVGIGLDYATRLDKSSNYLKKTASDFEKVEKDIIAAL
ncbi:MAG: DUF2974 domain-containing protein [Clostridia bacterium]|nr:DUF2974 domain-containing protein [Clostridia bacterium]